VHPRGGLIAAEKRNLFCPCRKSNVRCLVAIPANLFISLWLEEYSLERAKECSSDTIESPGIESREVLETIHMLRLLCLAMELSPFEQAGIEVTV
jgi:hypothetical protein